MKPDIFRGGKVALSDTYPGNPDSLPDGLTVDTQGYILPYGTGTGRPVEIPKNYLSAIPTGQLTLYQIAGVPFPQNPGW